MSDADRGREPPKNARYDRFTLHLRNRQRRRSLLDFKGQLAIALRLVWKADRRGVVLVVGGGLVSAVLLGGQVLVARKVLNVVLELSRGTGTTRDAILVVLLFGVVIATSSVVAAMGDQRTRLLGELAQRETWREVLDVCGNVRLETYEDPSFFDQLQRVETNAAIKPVEVCQGLAGLVGGLAGAISISVALLAIQPLLIPLLVLAGLPMLFTQRLAGKAEYRFAVAQTPPYRRRMYLRDLLSQRASAAEIRAHGVAGLLRRRYEAAYSEFTDALRRHVRTRLYLAVIGAVLTAVLTSLALVLLVLSLRHGRLAVADAGAGVIAIRLLASRLQQVVTGVGSIWESALFLEDLSAFLGRQRRSLLPTPAKARARPFARVSVQSVNFQYPSSSSLALSDVSLEFEAGQVVALVGENGSGKSTLAKVLANLYQPTGGQVCWDDAPLTEFEPGSVREHIAVVFQDFVRFELSARENIGLSRPGALDSESVERAADAAGAASFLSSLPNGYDTLLSTRYVDGVDLSLGQWQRVAISRAFHRDAPFVVLDEPSSALDPRAEAELFARVRQLFADRTVLLISHRLSSVTSADRIFVLDEGRLVESGDHQTLLANHGLYAELFEMQARAYSAQPRSSAPEQPEAW